jgi:hypothetical protein
MIIVKLVGGLTSQMHKYSIGRALAIKHNVPLKLDLSWFEDKSKSDTAWSYQLDYFNIKADIATKKEIDKLKGSDFYITLSRRIKYYLGIDIYKKSYVNTSFLPINEFSQLSNNLYIEGEWSGSQYFEQIMEQIKEELTLKANISSKVNTLISNIKSENSISLHIRRGDYISNKYAAQFHSTCTLSYYEKSIKHMNSNVNNPIFYIFSDDIKWAKENLKFDINMKFIDGNRNYEDLLLISSCSHNIIANSGFSWWGGLLNKNENKIIVAPTIWVKDKKLNDKVLNFLKADNIIFLEDK